MKVKQNGTVERNIYVEARSGSLRFTVEVSPFPKDHTTVDHNQYDHGLQWARRRRVELLEQKAQGTAPVVPPVPVIEPSQVPAHLRISDLIESYLTNELDKLSSAASVRSRLKRLGEWFGHLTLGQLTYNVLETWKMQRRKGALGSGRVSDPNFTKQERHKMKLAGEAVPALKVVKVSVQTVRHEIVLLRRVLVSYFLANGLNQHHGVWLHNQHIMQMKLPDKPQPRETRINDEELAALVREMDDPTHQAFVRFAVMTTLRRAEVWSLLWEDVDLDRKVVRLREPGHCRQTKTNGREVPLLPPTIQVLQKLGVKGSGPIFPITPSGISQAVRRAANKVGLRHVRLHDMRREGISRLVELLQASLEDVTIFSGHSDREVLQRHYLRPHSNIVGNRLAQR